MLQFLAADDLDPTSDVRIAIIGAIAVVLSASIPVLLRRLEHHTPPLPGTDPLILQLRRENVRVIRQLTQANGLLAQRDNRIRQLEQFCWTNQIDANTGVRMHTTP